MKLFYIFSGVAALIIISYYSWQIVKLNTSIGIKKDVDVSGLKEEIIYAVNIASDIFRNHGIEPVITSGMEGDHGPTSLHYAGLAVDMRTHSTPKEILPDVIRYIKTALGKEYDVILETDHLHIEYDPKN